MRPGFHALTVASVEVLCEDAVALSFAVPPELADDFAFSAGQSLTVRRMVDGREHRRSYSICAAEGQPPRIGVREIPDGLFSSWLVHEVTVGTSIEVQPPSGGFGVDGVAGGRHLCIAAGSGITPVLSVASTVLAHPDAQVTLVYGNRTSASVMFAEEVGDLKNRYGARFQVVHVLSREPREVELFSGRLDADRLRRLLDAVVLLEGLDHVWLCGPFEMATAAVGVLTELGVARDRVHRELFYVDEPPPELHRDDARDLGGEGTSAVTLLLDGLRATVTMPRDRAILDGAQLHRGDLPFACKGGVCGTCRALVVEGEVDMRRNFALDEHEVERGFVLTCQARPVSDRVSVDYDA